MAVRSFKYPLTKQTVERISTAKNEPGWMTDIRLEAWNLYESLPSPEGLAALDLSSLEGFVDPPITAAPSHEWPEDLQHTLNERGDEEGLIVQRDATILSRSMTKDSAKRGVIFCDMDTAVKSVPDLVRRYFGRLKRPDDKLSALRTAFSSGGCFLYVPEFVEVPLPFHICYWLSTPGSAIFPQLLVVAERGCQVYLMEEFLSSNWVGQNLAVSSVQFHVAERSRVHYFQLENWGDSVTHLIQQSSKVDSAGILYRWSATMGARADRISLQLNAMDGESMTSDSAAAGALDEVFCQELIAEGLSPTEAEYQAASRFFDPLLHRLPNDPLREKVRHYLVGKVTGRRKEVTLQRAAELHPEVRH